MSAVGPRRILVALDGSERSRDVLDAAIVLAERFDADLFLFRAVTVPPDFPAAAHTESGDPLPAFLVKEAKDAMSKLAAGNPRASAHAPVVAIGRPWKEICATSEALDVDLIVIGSHGYAGWDRVLGTNAARVADHATRSVLVVRSARSEREPAG